MLTIRCPTCGTGEVYYPADSDYPWTEKRFNLAIECDACKARAPEIGRRSDDDRGDEAMADERSADEPGVVVSAQEIEELVRPPRGDGKLYTRVSTAGDMRTSFRLPSSEGWTAMWHALKAAQSEK